MAQLFDMSIDQIINYDGSIPKEVILEDKTELEQIRLIQQLEEEDKQTIFASWKKCLPIKSLKIFCQKRSYAIKHKTHRFAVGSLLLLTDYKSARSG